MKVKLYPTEESRLENIFETMECAVSSGFGVVFFSIRDQGGKKIYLPFPPLHLLYLNFQVHSLIFSINIIIGMSLVQLLSIFITTRPVQNWVTGIYNFLDIYLVYIFVYTKFGLQIAKSTEHMVSSLCPYVLQAC